MHTPITSRASASSSVFPTLNDFTKAESSGNLHQIEITDLRISSHCPHTMKSFRQFRPSIDSLPAPLDAGPLWSSATAATSHTNCTERQAGILNINLTKPPENQCSESLNSPRNCYCPIGLTPLLRGNFPTIICLPENNPHTQIANMMIRYFKSPKDHFRKLLVECLALMTCASVPSKAGITANMTQLGLKITIGSPIQFKADSPGKLTGVIRVELRNVYMSPIPENRSTTTGSAALTQSGSSFTTGLHCSNSRANLTFNYRVESSTWDAGEVFTLTAGERVFSTNPALPPLPDTSAESIEVALYSGGSSSPFAITTVPFSTGLFSKQAVPEAWWLEMDANLLQVLLKRFTDGDAEACRQATDKLPELIKAGKIKELEWIESGSTTGGRYHQAMEVPLQFKNGKKWAFKAGSEFGTRGSGATDVRFFTIRTPGDGLGKELSVFTAGRLGRDWQPVFFVETGATVRVLLQRDPNAAEVFWKPRGLLMLSASAPEKLTATWVLGDGHPVLEAPGTASFSMQFRDTVGQQVPPNDDVRYFGKTLEWSMKPEKGTTFSYEAVTDKKGASTVCCVFQAYEVLDATSKSFSKPITTYVQKFDENGYHRNDDKKETGEAVTTLTLLP